MKTGKVYVSHDVTNFEFLYEPFYVAKDIVPAHDERFMGYGYTRNTQVRIPSFSITLAYFDDATVAPGHDQSPYTHTRTPGREVY